MINSVRKGKMDWIDYREKLGIAFSDEKKYSYFYTKIFNHIENIDFIIETGEYVNFCNMTSSIMNSNYLTDYEHRGRYRDIICILREHGKEICDFLSYYIALVNTIKDTDYRKVGKTQFKNLLCNMLIESHIPFDTLEDSEDFFVFPKGAEELDAKLVSEPLSWLSDYPVAHKAFVKALKSYADASEDNASNIADNFRKALESFCQEFFGGHKSLENYKSDIGNFLKDEGVPAEISGNFDKILNSYCLFINHYAKHRDATSDKLLEFIMYQTGSFIRLLITFKKSL